MSLKIDPRLAAKDTVYFWSMTLELIRLCSTQIGEGSRLQEINNICKKTQFSSGDLLFNEKQKKGLLSFIIHIITLISYCCFVSASDLKGSEWSGCEFVLSWSVSRFFFGLFRFSSYFRNQNSYLKINVLSKLLKVIV